MKIGFFSKKTEAQPQGSSVSSQDAEREITGEVYDAFHESALELKQFLRMEGSADDSIENSSEESGDINYSTRFLYTGPDQVMYLEMCSLVDPSANAITAIILTEPVIFSKQNHEGNQVRKMLVWIAMETPEGERSHVHHLLEGDLLDGGTSSVRRGTEEELSDSLSSLRSFIGNKNKSGPVRDKRIVENFENFTMHLLRNSPKEISPGDYTSISLPNSSNST